MVALLRSASLFPTNAGYLKSRSSMMAVVVHRRFYFLQMRQFLPYSAILTQSKLAACLISVFGMLFTFLMHYYIITNSSMFVGMVFGRPEMATEWGISSAMDTPCLDTPPPTLNAFLGVGNQSGLT